MLNRLIPLLLVLAFDLWPACSSATIPTDYLTVDKWRRAGEAANWTAIKDAQHDCADSLNLGPLTRIVNWSTALQVKSLQDLGLKIDDDNNGTHRFALLNGGGDTVWRVSEDSAAKAFGTLAVAGRTTLSDSLIAISARWTGNLSAVNGAFSGTLGVTGAFTGTSGAFSTTLSVTGIQTNSAALTFGGVGSGADWTLWRSAGAGLAIRGGAGSSYDLSLFSPAGSYLMRNPTSGTAVEFPGSGVTVAGTLGITGAQTNASTLGVTGALTVNATGGGPAAGIAVRSANPSVALNDSDAAADNKWWDVLASGEQLRYRAINDANSASGNFMTVDRTGTTIDNVTFPGAALIVSSLAGTGTRLTTSTSAGVQGNATTIAGSYEFSALMNLAAGLGFSGNGTSAAATITRLAGDGLQVRGIAGSSYDLALMESGGSYLLRNPIGGTVLEFPGTGNTFSGTADFAGKVTGSDTIAAVLGFRAGNTGASNTILYRSGADMWTTPDSLTVGGKIVADTLISAKFYEEGSFTGTLTGVSGSVTNTIRYTRVGKQVTILISQFIGTSNATTCTITGMPASIRPSREVAFLAQVMDNTSYTGGSVGSEEEGFSIGTSGTITLYIDGNAGGFTAAGIKGLYAGAPDVTTGSTTVIPFTYTLQ